MLAVVCLHEEQNGPGEGSQGVLVLEGSGETADAEDIRHPDNRGFGLC